MKKLMLVAIVPLGLMLACGGGRGQGEWIEASGVIEAVQINISAKVGGQLKHLQLREGALVEAGDTLAVIDHELLALQLRQALAGSDLARIQYQTDLKDDQRAEQLFQKGSISQKQRDDASLRFRSSSARLEQSRAAADIIRKNISDCFITSPAPGILSRTPFEPGEVVGPGGIIGTVLKTDTVDLVVYVNEVDLGRIKLGQEVEIAIDAFKNKRYPGRVVYISPEAEFTPKNIQTKQDRVKQVFAVKIKIPNPDRDLKPGMPADARIMTELGK